MTKLDKLRALAEKATPGPWVVDYEVYHGMTTANVKDCAIVKREVGRNLHIVDQPRNYSSLEDDTNLIKKQERDFTNAAFIAATNPETIKALIDDRAELIAAIREVYEDYYKWVDEESIFVTAEYSEAVQDLMSALQKSKQRWGE